MSLEQALIDHTAAILKLDATIAENTATMKSIAGTPANVTAMPKATKKTPAPEPAPEPAAPAVGETPPEPEDPVVEESPEHATPVVEESPAPADDDYTQWDAPKLRLAVQEYCKTRLTSGTDESIAKFKEAFNAELTRLDVPKAAKLADDQLADFYAKALTW